jgi:hypothetical protein
MMRDQTFIKGLRQAQERRIGNQGESQTDLEGLKRADDEALAELARARFVERSITDEEFRAARQGLLDRKASINAKLDQIQGDKSLDIDGPMMSFVWENATLDQRRTLLLTFFEAIIVEPARGRGRRFDGNRIRPIPKGQRVGLATTNVSPT